MTMKQFFSQFPDDETCLAHIFNSRFGQGHVCPKCDQSAKWYRIKAERAYSCQHCGHHIHPTAGTIFQDTRTPLQSWFYAIYLFTVTRHGVSAKELQRQLGVTYKTAWRIGLQIRRHMEKINGSGPLSGIVEVDETMIGGKRSGKRGRGASGKTSLVGMAERGGRVALKAVPDCSGRSLAGAVEKNVSKEAEVHTDQWTGYNGLKEKGYKHKTVNHSSGSYVAGNVHVNSVENVWYHLQRAIRGTHISVSGKHLMKYASEFSYRYNRRKTPDVMLPELLSVFPA